MSLAPQVDLERFMGTWFVIGNIPTFIEKGCEGGIEHYDYRSPDRVDITFSCFSEGLEGKEKIYNPKAWVLAENEWRVQFLWPFKADFLILEVAEDYSWTVVGHPSKKYVWVMHRERQMPSEILEARKTNLVRQGYSLENFQLVKQPASFEEVRKVSLEDLKWTNRVVVLSGQDRNLVRTQHRLLSRDKAGKAERKLKILLPEELSAADQERLKLGPNQPGFELALVGLDGEVKWRVSSQVRLQDIFDRIDQMPMRRNESEAP